jgi:DNA-binding MarR family transcriptional regulator
VDEMAAAARGSDTVPRGEGTPRCGPGAPGPGVGWLWGEPSPRTPPGDDPGERFPPDAPLQVLLLAASKLMGTFYGETVSRAGIRISPAGLGVLRVLLAGDGLKSSDVAARGWSAPGTLTSVVDTLVREGYVERRRDPGDRRVVRLFVTEDGRQACAEYFALAGPCWHDAFSFVDPGDEPVIRKFFVDMIEHFGELIRKERGR